MSGVSGEGLRQDRGYRKLVAFQVAHSLVLETYKLTSGFAKAEQFGLTSQMRRAAVSVAANIVEGYSLSTTRQFLRHLDISFGSCKELDYYFELARELGYADDTETDKTLDLAGRAAFLIVSLVRGLRNKLAERGSECGVGGEDCSALSTPSTPSTPAGRTIG